MTMAISQGLRAELDPETTKGKAGPLAEFAGAAAARPAQATPRGDQAADRRQLARDGWRARRGPDGGPTRPGLGCNHRLVCPLGRDVRLPRRPTRPPRPARDTPGRRRPRLSRARRTTPPRPSRRRSGLAVARVVPNGNADLNGIREGDVLLSYAGTELKQAGDLKPVAPDGGPKKVPVRYWREGISREHRGRRRAAGRGHRPPAGGGVRPRPPRVANRSCWGCGAGRTPGCPAPAARSRPSPRSSPTGEPPPSWARKPARRPCRAWPARASSRASATSTSPPTARPTPASPTAPP